MMVKIRSNVTNFYFLYFFPSKNLDLKITILCILDSKHKEILGDNIEVYIGVFSVPTMNILK